MPTPPEMNEGAAPGMPGSGNGFVMPEFSGSGEMPSLPDMTGEMPSFPEGEYPPQMQNDGHNWDNDQMPGYGERPELPENTENESTDNAADGDEVTEQTEGWLAIVINAIRNFLLSIFG